MSFDLGDACTPRGLPPLASAVRIDYGIARDGVARARLFTAPLIESARYLI